jgi:hypothetical protein
MSSNYVMLDKVTFSRPGFEKFLFCWHWGFEFRASCLLGGHSYCRPSFNLLNLVIYADMY